MSGLRGGGRADVDRRGVGVLPPTVPCARRRRAPRWRARSRGTRAPSAGASGSWSSRDHPLGACVYTFHAHSSWWAATSAIDASAASSGPTSGTAWPCTSTRPSPHSCGREVAAALHRVDRQRVGVTDDRHRRDDGHRGVAAAEHEVAPVVDGEAVRRVGLAARRLREAGAERGADVLEEVGLHVDDRRAGVHHVVGLGDVAGHARRHGEAPAALDAERHAPAARPPIRARGGQRPCRPTTSGIAGATNRGGGRGRRRRRGRGASIHGAARRAAAAGTRRSSRATASAAGAGRRQATPSHHRSTVCGATLCGERIRRARRARASRR